MMIIMKYLLRTNPSKSERINVTNSQKKIDSNFTKMETEYLTKFEVKQSNFMYHKSKLIKKPCEKLSTTHEISLVC